MEPFTRTTINTISYVCMVHTETGFVTEHHSTPLMVVPSVMLWCPKEGVAVCVVL